MALRIIPDEGKPSAALEISLDRPLLDYDLEQIDQPTPRDVDGVLVSQGFRDLIDDARGILTDLIAHEPHAAASKLRSCELDLSHSNEHALQLEQLTGAICPGDDEVYRPGIWIILRDTQANPKASLPQATKERIASIGRELMRRLQLED
ncbi:MAG TPA: hypothetical protein VH022_01970 [Candidatus Acidoferrum sp.]|jgi:hypothetical protein|nr:hypothetical protein [Candidatus Acidoferrum sp.]